MPSKAKIARCMVQGARSGPLTESDKSRALARFRDLSGRSVKLAFIGMGVVVDATSPDELRAAGARALVARGGDFEN